ncbi:MAG: purine-nucleoside phosphorylase [Gemmatimonadota bacterium]
MTAGTSIASPPSTGLAERVRESADVLRARGFPRPRAALVLGTGLGALATAIDPAAEIAYADVPHLPPSTAVGHAGRLIGGTLAGAPVVAMQGRLHVYEGYTMQEVTFPVRVLRELGAEVLVLSNAAGGLDPLFRLGDLMLVEDHINLMGDNPLRGPNDDRLGPRFPDLSRAYDPELLELAEEVALAERLRVRRGVYAAVPGPSLETRAEYRFLRTAGADAVGMSTAPETIVASHAGMRVLAVSVITDLCLPDALEPADIAAILRVAAEAEGPLVRLVAGTLGRALAAPVTLGGSRDGDGRS